MGTLDTKPKARTRKRMVEKLTTSKKETKRIQTYDGRYLSLELLKKLIRNAVKTMQTLSRANSIFPGPISSVSFYCIRTLSFQNAFRGSHDISSGNARNT